MSNERNPHLWIPQDRVRYTPVVQGSGGKSFTREDVEAHSAALLEAFTDSLDRFSGKADLYLASELIVEVTTPETWPAGRERQHLRNLGFEIVAYSPAGRNIAIARIPQGRLPRFQQQLRRYALSAKHIGKSNFSAIERIQPVGIARKVEPTIAEAAQEAPTSCLISIYAALPDDLKTQVAERVVAYLLERGKTEVEVHRFANGSVAVSAQLTRPEMEQLAEQFMLVRSIESNAEVVMETAVQADPVPTIIQVDPVRCQTPVGVVDSGVNAAAPLMAGFVARVVNELPAGSVGPHMAHGTFVASRIVYGDGITSVLAHRAVPWCPIVDIQVTGDDGIGNRVSHNAAHLGEILQRVVPSLAGEVKVYNISLGIAPISDGHYSELAKLLDFLSREYRVMFVISAGNIDLPRQEPPRHYLEADTRILFPSEALLGITVGSVAHYDEPECAAAPGEVSPFSRRGPGADSGLKPELAAHGGNVIWNGLAWSTTPRLAVYGLGRAGTHLEYSIGTSFAAPIVAQYAARLFDAYPQASPNLVKALLCHYATPVRCPAPGVPLEDHHFCGFGEPDIDRAIFASGSSAGMLFEGELTAANYMHVPFHVPEAVAGDGRSRLAIRGTIVFDPPVSVDDPVNYSLCRIAGLLRKRAKGVMRDVSIGGAEDDVLLPWNPLVHFRHAFRHGYESGEWELRLRLMTRGNLPEEFAQQVAVVLEIVDQSNTVDVRTAVLREFGSFYVPVELQIAA